jgi:hypothetical protein
MVKSCKSQLLYCIKGCARQRRTQSTSKFGNFSKVVLPLTARPQQLWGIVRNAVLNHSSTTLHVWIAYISYIAAEAVPWAKSNFWMSYGRFFDLAKKSRQMVVPPCKMNQVLNNISNCQHKYSLVLPIWLGTKLSSGFFISLVVVKISALKLWSLFVCAAHHADNQ